MPPTLAGSKNRDTRRGLGVWRLAKQAVRGCAWASYGGNTGFAFYGVAGDPADVFDLIVTSGGKIVQMIGADAPKLPRGGDPGRKRNRPLPAPT